MARMQRSLVFAAAALCALLFPGSSSARFSGRVGGRRLQGTACPTSTTFKGLDYSFENCVTLDSAGDFKLAWTWNENSKNLTFCFVGRPDEPYGWAAWGFSPYNNMVGSKVVVAYGDPNNTTYAMVQPYDLEGTSQEQVVVNNSIGVDSRSLQVEITDNGNLIDIHGTIPNFNASTSPSVIWMGGPGVDDYSTGLLQKHLVPFQPTLVVDFTATTAPTPSAPESSLKSTKITHAWLAGLGFGVFLPLGVVVARYLKAWVDPGWFYAHMGIQLLGYLFGVIGWGYGIFLKGEMGSLANAPSYTQNHYAIGITIFCTATLQILTPVVKPDKEAKLRLFWNIVHWGLGYLTIILSIANVFLGFENLEQSGIAYQAWQAVYITYIVFVGAIVVVLEVVAWKRYYNNGGSSEISLKPMRLQDSVQQEESLNPYPSSV